MDACETNVNIFGHFLKIILSPHQAKNCNLKKIVGSLLFEYYII